MQVVIHGMTMAYEEYGAGPAVLFIDGFAADCAGWKTYAQSLAMAGYRVIVQQFCNSGNAATATGESGREGRSEAIVGLLNYLGIGRAAIIGRLTGDGVLHGLVQRYPQRVAAVVSADGLKSQGAGTGGKRLQRLMPKRRAGATTHPEGGSEVARKLLDCLNTLKKFRSRYPITLQVA